MSIAYTWWIIIITISGFGMFLAFFLGWKFAKKHFDGVIRIETNEDNTREAVRFILNMDLDQIREEKQIVFKVEDLSKNSQT